MFILIESNLSNNLFECNCVQLLTPLGFNQADKKYCLNFYSSGNLVFTLNHILIPFHNAYVFYNKCVKKYNSTELLVLKL